MGIVVVLLILLVLALIAVILVASDDNVGECSDDDICGQDKKYHCIHWSSCDDCPIYKKISEENGG